MYVNLFVFKHLNCSISLPLSMLVFVTKILQKQIIFLRNTHS